MPLGAYAPVRYTSTGTKISLDCAETSCTAPRAPAAASARAAACFLNIAFISSSSLGLPSSCAAVPDASMRKGPEPQFLLADRPQAREPARLDDQEEHDERAEE